MKETNIYKIQRTKKKKNQENKEFCLKIKESMKLTYNLKDKVLMVNRYMEKYSQSLSTREMEIKLH